MIVLLNCPVVSGIARSRAVSPSAVRRPVDFLPSEFTRIGARVAGYADVCPFGFVGNNRIANNARTAPYANGLYGIYNIVQLNGGKPFATLKRPLTGWRCLAHDR